MSEILKQSPSHLESETEIVRRSYLDNLKFLTDTLSQELSRDRLGLFANYPPVRDKPRNLRGLRDGINVVSEVLSSQEFNPNPDKFRSHLIETLKANGQLHLLKGVNLALETLNMTPIQEDALASDKNS